MRHLLSVSLLAAMLYSFHAPSGTGGTNGGSIFTQGELDDDGNACIQPAVNEMQALFKMSPRVSLADAMYVTLRYVTCHVKLYFIQCLMRLLCTPLHVHTIRLAQCFLSFYNVTGSLVVLWRLIPWSSPVWICCALPADARSSTAWRGEIASLIPILIRLNSSRWPTV